LPMLKPLKRNDSKRPVDERAIESSKTTRSVRAFVSREAVALVVVAFGLLSAVSVIHPALVDGYEVSGVVTRSLYRFYSQWFGVLQLVPPLLLCALGVRMLLGPATLRLYKRCLGLYLVAFAVSSAIHMAQGNDLRPAGWYPAGLFGKFNHDLLIPGLFDSWGGAVVLGFIAVIGASLSLCIPVPKLILELPARILRSLRSAASRVVCWLSALRATIARGFYRVLDAVKRFFAAPRRVWQGFICRLRRARPEARPDFVGHQEERATVAKPSAAAPVPSQTGQAGYKPQISRPAKKAVEAETSAETAPHSEVTGAESPVVQPRIAEKPLFAPEELTLLPPVTLLDRYGDGDQSRTQDQSELLVNTLRSFDVEAQVINRMVGPVVTRYELSPAPGERVSKIVRLADDIALSLAANGIRIEAPIPGKAAIGIEVPNKEPALVGLRDIVESPEFTNHRSKLCVVLGKDIAGRCIVGDLVKMVHLLVAGATGSGKSVYLNTLITSILLKATADEVKFLMIDPKRVELTTFDGIPHLIAPVVTDPKKAAGYLLWVVEQMENRYKLFHAAGVRNIERYNAMCASSGADGQTPNNPLPYYVVIVDELADMMMVAQAEVEASISRLAFMARAAGIHLVIATQRPSADVVTGIIKANIPSRIAFSVSSGIDSRIILDCVGAEKLLGRGDMLYLPNGASKPMRVQGAYMSDEEIQRVTDYLKGIGRPKYEAESRDLKDVQGGSETEESDEEDEYFREAVKLVIETGQASVSMLQRRFPIGYSRAGRLIDAMEEKGIVGPHEGSKPRKILYERGEWQRWLPAGSDRESVEHALLEREPVEQSAAADETDEEGE
jgi:S-DNA-T family DNA segregation ATPase FtsK/SpoIIIE